MRLMTIPLCSCFVLAFAACGDDDKDGGDTTNTTDTQEEVARADTSTPDTFADVPHGETAEPDTAGPDTTEPADTTPAETDTAEPARVDEACSEAGYTDCFINDDCPAAERCQNMSANEVEIPCCVPGVRGTGAAGVPCTNENECASSLCISYNDGPFLCSAPCDGSEGACPEAAPECVFGLCVPGGE